MLECHDVTKSSTATTRWTAKHQDADLLFGASNFKASVIVRAA
jgi:hypothetical protein